MSNANAIFIEGGRAGRLFRLALGFWLGALWLLTGSVQAQLPTARLLTLVPPGGQAGSQFELTVNGQDLDEAAALYFSQSGITAELKPGQSGDSHDAKVFLVHLATNTPPGIGEARVAGRFGVSNPRAFAVGALPESALAGGNDTLATAAPLELDTTVNGHCEANAAQYFKFTARARQRVVVVCAARELDSRLDPALVLYDAAGLELERGRRNGLLDFTARADGDYVLKVSDAIYRGGGEYFYRLTAGTGPHLDFIYPPAGVPGTKGKFVLYGRNLPGGTAAKDMTV